MLHSNKFPDINWICILFQIFLFLKIRWLKILLKAKYMDAVQAKSYCDDLGMTLPVPEDQATNDALYDITGGNFYLGISDAAVEGDFRNIYTDTTITFSAWNNVSS